MPNMEDMEKNKQRGSSVERIFCEVEQLVSGVVPAWSQHGPPPQKNKQCWTKESPSTLMLKSYMPSTPNKVRLNRQAQKRGWQNTLFFLPFFRKICVICVLYLISAKLSSAKIGREWSSMVQRDNTAPVQRLVLGVTTIEEMVFALLGYGYKPISHDITVHKEWPYPSYPHPIPILSPSYPHPHFVHLSHFLYGFLKHNGMILLN